MKERKTRAEETLGQSGAVALFDVDQTLISGYTVFPFVDMLIDQNVVDGSISKVLRNDRLRRKKSAITYQQFADDVVTHYCQGLAGRSQQQVEEVGRQFLAFIRPVMLCGFSPELVREMNKHARTIAISGSPVEVLQPLAKHLGITDAQGLEAEVSNGYYTGKVKTNMAIRDEKEKVIATLVNRGFSKQTSFAFGDSDSDIPILEAVDNPFAVNPNPALAEIAARNGWQIVNSENVLSRVMARLAKLRPNQP